MNSINDLIDLRNLEVEEQIEHDLRKMSRYDRRKAFRQAGIIKGAKESSLAQRNRKGKR